MEDIDFIVNRTQETHNRIMDLDFKKAIKLAQEIFNFKKTGNKVIFMGNGASYTIANHAALDYMGQTGVITMSVADPAILTAFSNDFGYDEALKRFAKINYKEGDILICISSSGNSPNVVKAAEYVKSIGGKVIGFTGFDKNNNLSKIVDRNFWVDSHHYNVVESIHNIWLAMICDLMVHWMGDQVGKHGINL